MINISHICGKDVHESEIEWSDKKVTQEMHSKTPHFFGFQEGAEALDEEERKNVENARNRHEDPEQGPQRPRYTHYHHAQFPDCLDNTNHAQHFC